MNIHPKIGCGANIFKFFKTKHHVKKTTELLQTELVSGNFVVILIFFSFSLTLLFNETNSNLLIILLQSSHVLHALTLTPMNQGTLGVHQINLEVELNPGLSNSHGVAQSSHSVCRDWNVLNLLAIYGTEKHSSPYRPHTNYKRRNPINTFRSDTIYVLQ